MKPWVSAGLEFESTNVCPKLRPISYWLSIPVMTHSWDRKQCDLLILIFIVCFGEGGVFTVQDQSTSHQHLRGIHHAPIHQALILMLYGSNPTPAASPHSFTSNVFSAMPWEMHDAYSTLACWMMFRGLWKVVIAYGQIKPHNKTTFNELASEAKARHTNMHNNPQELFVWVCHSALQCRTNSLSFFVLMPPGRSESTTWPASRPCIRINTAIKC